MILSMTGFGSGELILDNSHFNFYIKSLNSKNLDITLKIPSSLRILEFDIRRLISKKLIRGKVELLITQDYDSQELYIQNTDLFKSEVSKIEEMRKSLIEEKIISENFSDNFWTGSAKHLQIFNRTQNNSSNLNTNNKKKILQKVKEIIEELSQFRLKEGSVLEKDLLYNINSIYNNLERINKRATKRKNQIRTKLQNKILRLKEVEKDRFEQEIIYYIEKYDINEELVRLDSHLNLFQKNINSNKPVGKKLGFISQEIGREINTIGSKANDFNIQKIVISMKENLEKVKEQILNVL
ncbi:YicC family protein [Bacteroidota bacterium]|nr:YicC family protein [Bacteroidota bacterium]MDC3230342.1 YicC family protein [Bacteroidota bacterium]